MGSIRLSPYYLKRNCRKAQYTNSGTMSEIIDLYFEVGNNNTELEKRLEELDELIYHDIGLMENEERRKAINLRRTIRKKQFKGCKHDIIMKLFSDDTRHAYNRCMETYEHDKQLRKDQENVLKQCRRKSFLRLVSELNNNILFKNALMISMNSELYGNITRLGNFDAYPENKKYRDTILSAQNYYNRMLHKPTPFSTFVNVAIGLFEDKNIHVATDEACSSICINILFLNILKTLFLQDNKEFIGEFYVKLNPTAEISSDSVKFLKVDTSDPKYMFYRENFVDIKIDPRIQAILNKAGNKNNHLLSFAAELAKLPNLFRSMEEAAVLILKLSSAGLMFKNFNICSDDNYLSRLSALCENRNSLCYTEIREHLTDIGNIIREMNVYFDDIDLKQKMRDSVYEHVKNILKYYSLTPRELNFQPHNIIFENSVYTHIDRSEIHPSKERIERLSEVAKIFRIFDNNYITKILYRNIFLNSYGKDERISLLDFYKIVENFRNEYDVIFNDSDIKRIKKMRKAFFEILQNKINNDAIRITSEEIDDIYSGAPLMMNVPKSYGIYYQLSGEKLVVNNTAPGFGRHFMRYIDGLNEEEMKVFLDSYRRNTDRTQYGRLYDIGTDLGLNINKHIPCLDSAIDYPQSLYKRNSNSLSNERYFVCYDEEYDQLCISNDSGERIEVTPIGFIFPRVAPGYYRFLSVFSNSQGAEISFWDRYYSYYNSNSDSIRLPRIELDGDIVIERKTWKIPCSELKFVEGSETENYIRLADKLFYERGIPHRFFAKISSDIDGILVKNKNIESWVTEITNKRIRKPQFYDLDNYIDYKNFMRVINNHDKVITIQETLPDGNDIVEYLIEFADEA